MSLVGLGLELGLELGQTACLLAVRLRLRVEYGICEYVGRLRDLGSCRGMEGEEDLVRNPNPKSGSRVRVCKGEEDLVRNRKRRSRVHV